MQRVSEAVTDSDGDSDAVSSRERGLNFSARTHQKKAIISIGCSLSGTDCSLGRAKWHILQLSVVSEIDEEGIYSFRNFCFALDPKFSVGSV
jgi:hypothetical protein